MTMWPVFPLPLTFSLAGALFVIVLVSMRWVQPEWWQSRAARGLVLAAFGAIFVGVAIWGSGRGLGQLALVHAGAGLAYVGVLIVFPATLVMPFAAAIDRIGRRQRAIVPQRAPDADVSLKRALTRR